MRPPRDRRPHGMTVGYRILATRTIVGWALAHDQVSLLPS
jgi:hypothetical protein